MVGVCLDEESPYHENFKIYKYMNFDKFLLMLRDGSLYFHRSDKLVDNIKRKRVMLLFQQ